MVVYIAGKFRGANAWAVAQNVRAAEGLAMSVAELGAMPLTPHSIGAHFDGTLTAEFWLEGTKELLRRCDAMIVLPDSATSQGTLGEIIEADKRGIPCFFDLGALERWLAGQISVLS